MAKALLASGISGSTAISGTSVTFFYSPTHGTLHTTNSATITEAQMEVTCRKAATVSRLGVHVNANGRSTATAVTFRKNGANGNQAISVAASATGYFEDTTNTDSLTAGDTFCIAVALGTGAGSFNIVYLLAAIESASGPAHSYYGPQGTGSSNYSLSTATSYFCPIVGRGNALISDSDNNGRVVVPADGTFSNLQVYVRTNTLTGGTGTTVKSRVNGADGNQSVSIANAATGLFEDTTHSDSITSGQTAGTHITLTNSGGSIIIQRITMMFVSTMSDDSTFVGGIGSTAFNNATRYAAFSGDDNASANETQADFNMPFDGTVSNLYARANTFPINPTSITVRNNAADTAVTVSRSASGAATISDTSNSATFADGDNLNIKWTSTGTVTTAWHTLRITPAAAATGRARRVFSLMGF